MRTLPQLLLIGSDYLQGCCPSAHADNWKFVLLSLKKQQGSSEECDLWMLFRLFSGFSLSFLIRTCIFLPAQKRGREGSLCCIIREKEPALLLHMQQFTNSGVSFQFPTAWSLEANKTVIRQAYGGWKTPPESKKTEYWAWFGSCYWLACNHRQVTQPLGLSWKMRGSC